MRSFYILNRKVTQRLRTILDTPVSSELRDVFPALIAVSSLEYFAMFLYIYLISFFLNPTDVRRTGTDASTCLYECV
jgi:hypothetical protein